MTLTILAAAAFCYSAGGYFMKLSQALTRLWPTVAVFVLFTSGAALQTLGMRHGPMGVTYVAVLGLEALSALGLGVVLLGEKVSVPTALGALLVVAGVAVLRMGVS